MNHKLNSEVNRIFAASENPQIAKDLMSVAATMRTIQNSTVKWKALRRYSVLKPIIYNKTRWEVKVNCKECFLCTHKEMIQANRVLPEDKRFPMDTTDIFSVSRKMLVLSAQLEASQGNCKNDSYPCVMPGCGLTGWDRYMLGNHSVHVQRTPKSKCVSRSLL